MFYYGLFFGILYTLSRGVFLTMELNMDIAMLWFLQLHWFFTNGDIRFTLFLLIPCHWMHLTIFWWHLLVVTVFLFTSLLCLSCAPQVHFMWFILSRICSIIPESLLIMKSLAVVWIQSSVSGVFATWIRVRGNRKGRKSVKEKKSSRCLYSPPAAIV